MKKYTVLILAEIKSSFKYRFKIITTLLFNSIYLFLLFFIWRSIYESNETISGLTFIQTYTYMSISTVLISLFNSRTDWKVSMRVTNGSIISYYTKPVSVQLQFFFDAIGSMCVQFLLVTMPVVLIVTHVRKLGISLNVLFFIISLLLAFTINFCLEYIVGTLSFYTESLWGIIILKNTVISFLSGGLVPLYFFPDIIQPIIKWLPFRCIIDIPIDILFEQTKGVSTISNLLTQIAWVLILIIISRYFFHRSEKVLIINGG